MPRGGAEALSVLRRRLVALPARHPERSAPMDIHGATLRRQPRHTVPPAAGRPGRGSRAGTHGRDARRRTADVIGV